MDLKQETLRVVPNYPVFYEVTDGNFVAAEGNWPQIDYYVLILLQHFNEVTIVSIDVHWVPMQLVKCMLPEWLITEKTIILIGHPLRELLDRYEYRKLFWLHADFPCWP